MLIDWFGVFHLTESENRMVERGHDRRKYSRFEATFPINFRIIGFTPVGPKAVGIRGIGTRIQGRVGNVSLEGLFIEADPTQDQISEIIKARQGQDRFEIEIETWIIAERIQMKGKVVWYDINFEKDAPYHFRAGVFLEEVSTANSRPWKSLMNRAKHEN